MTTKLSARPSGVRSVPALVEVVCCDSTPSELVSRITRNLMLRPSKKPREVLGLGFFEGNILIRLFVRNVSSSPSGVRCVADLLEEFPPHRGLPDGSWECVDGYAFLTSSLRINPEGYLPFSCEGIPI